MKYIALIIAGIILVNGWTTPKFQQGSDVGTESGTGVDTLRAGKQVGRSVPFDVQFKTPFDNVPQVVISSSIIELQAGVPIGYKAEVVTVSNTGFTFRIVGLTDKALYQMKYNWFATDDPRIHVMYVESDQLGALSTGLGDRTQDFSIPYDNFKLQGNARALTYLIGAKFDQGEPISLKLKTVEARGDGVTIRLQTTANNVISYASMCIVATDYDGALVGETVGVKPAVSHAWTTGLGDRFEEGQTQLTAPFKIAGDKGNAVGITGYSSRHEGQNTRFIVKPLMIGAKSANNKYGTWDNSKPIEIYYQVLIYKPDDYRVYSTVCAELYTECNYEGKMIKLCNTVNDFPAAGFTGPVKSIKIPPGQQIQLYNRQSLQGKQIVFSDDQKCLADKDIQFTLF